jgi:glycosyltransferase involved in cell wall biosynthesis
VSPGTRLRVHWEGEFAGTASFALTNVELARRLAGRASLSLAPWPAPGADSPTPPDDMLAALVRDPPADVDVTLTWGSPPRLEPPARGRWAWTVLWDYGSGVPVDWFELMRSRADAVLVFSDWVAAQVRGAGVPPDRVHTMPLGVDVATFHPDAPPLELPTRKRVRLLYVGGLTHRKGVDILLRAYRQAFSAADDVALVIRAFDPGGRYAGVALNGFEADFAGPDAPELVVLRDHLDRAELPGLYTACDALVQPYRAEGFCLPIAEAMACGVPVVTTDRGGASGFATAETATLLPSFPVYMPVLRLGDRALTNLPSWREVREDALVETLLALVAGRLEDHRERARAHIVNTFTFDATAERLHATLERVATEPRSAPPPPGVFDDGDAAAAVKDGEALLRASDVDGAGAAFHRALALAGAWRDVPTDEEAVVAALAGMGAVAGAVGLAENAYRFHRLAVDRRPTPGLRVTLASWAAKTGRTQEAGEELGHLVGGP